MKKINYLIMFFTVVLGFPFGCTNLKQEVYDGELVSSSGNQSINVSAQLVAAYQGLETFAHERRVHAIQQLSSDEKVGPTRGGDWDNNGTLRQLYLHTWDPLHGLLKDTWNEMLSGVYAANLVLENNPTPSHSAQARYIRAYIYYHVLDLFGQVPYREFKSNIELDAKVMQRTEATQFLIKELEEILPDLGVLSDPTVANKDAAHFLLAKLYLNKAVYTAKSPAGPYTFIKEDMDKVIDHVDAMTARLTSDYWINFSVDNSAKSSEIIFAKLNNASVSNSRLYTSWIVTNHYNQFPAGWNGFTTLPTFYDSFDPNDYRINNPDSEVLKKSGYNLGFQIGQQYGPGGSENGVALKDRLGNPLIYTKEIQLLTAGSTLETAGIRGVKYKPDYANLTNPGNDYVLARYSDALLMKAEAILRGGSSLDTPLSIVNIIRGRVKQPALGSVDLKELLAERGRELWWEGWRRNDQIRFETFLKPKDLKSSASTPEKVIFPIPAGALSNPNLKQNP